MKYIDGIKNDKTSKSWFGKMFANAEQSCMRLTIRPVKHIPITYYKPLTLYPKNGGSWLLADMDNIDNLKWIDGQPYELIIKGEDK